VTPITARSRPWNDRFPALKPRTSNRTGSVPPESLENAGKASAARADDFATSVRLQLEGALAKAKDNLTRAAVLLNESGHRSAAGKLWQRRSVAAVAR
jgi:hypothetical protein